MKQMLAFTNTEVTKAELIAVLERHKAADAFVQGIYYEDGKGGAVGCSLHDFGAAPDDHAAYERLFGIPEVLARLEDRIFEGLGPKEKDEWPLVFANAVQEGADLTQVYPQFQIWLLIDPRHGIIRFAETEEQRKIIKDCADLFADWSNVDINKAHAAYTRAALAARTAYAAHAAYAAAAASHAAHAAYARADDADAAAAAYARADDAAAASAHAYTRATPAAYAARKSHYTVMADKLIELIEAAPVVKG